MNRYELHQEIEEARKEGYSKGYDAGFTVGEQRGKFGPKAVGDAASSFRFGRGKPTVVAHFVRLPDRDAYELQARLEIGDKWYAAKQHITREQLMFLTGENRRDVDKHISRWLQGATDALLDEFKKDFQYKLPELPI